MASEVFDIDEISKAFEPVRIKFRGVEYTLGSTVMQLLNAASVFQGILDDDAPKDEQAKAVFENLRPVLRALSPDLAEVINENDLTAGEEAALLRPSTAALNLLSVLSFREKEDKEQDSGGPVPELLSPVQSEGSE